MTITVNVGDADLSELLEKVAAGEDVILVRNGIPVAKLEAVDAIRSEADLVETMIRERAARQPVTQAEIAEWTQTGRR
jgi:prevent-host-death family protein